MSYGVTIQGFVMPQLADLQTDLNQGLQTEFGAGINLEPSSFFGQFVGLVAERLSLVWQAMQDVYTSQTPDTAFGASLDNVGALRGIPRLLAQASSIQNVRLFGTAGTPVPNTFRASVVGSPLSIFQISGATTLANGQNCVQRIDFSALAAAGNWSLSLYGHVSPVLNFNATAAQVQAAIQTLPFCSGCVVTGSMAAGFVVTFTGAGTGGLMVQPLFGVATNTLQSAVPAPINVTPSITTPGLDQARVTMVATATGPTVAPTGSLTNIVTPITGVTGILNTQDAAVGMNVESDNAYRARMLQELQVAGAGTVEAIRARLLKVANVQSALVYENIMDVPDGQGRYPHSFEAVVSGGDDAAIAEAIWLAKPAGIATFGTQVFTITDSQGVTHDIRFSRPTIIDVYVTVTVQVTGLYPANGDALIQQAMASYINGLGQGVSVIIIPKLMAQLASIPGIDDATITAGTVPGPGTEDNIVIQPYQQAASQTNFITVIHGVVP